MLQGDTPLHVAAVHRHVKMFGWLLQNGASVELRNLQGDSYRDTLRVRLLFTQLYTGRTPLDFALLDYARIEHVVCEVREEKEALKEANRVLGKSAHSAEREVARWRLEHLSVAPG